MTDQCETCGGKGYIPHYDPNGEPNPSLCPDCVDEWVICEVHKSPRFGMDAGREFCEYAYIKQYDGPPNECRMVHKLLIDPETRRDADPSGASPVS